MARTPPLTDRTFRHKEPDSRLLTHERIAEHLQAFQSSGGRIEVLGTTRVLKKMDEADASPDAQPLAPAPSAPRSARKA